SVAITPKGSHSIAQGRAAHPGDARPRKSWSTPQGLHNRSRCLCNPCGVTALLFKPLPQGALRDPGLLSATPAGCMQAAISTDQGTSLQGFHCSHLTGYCTAAKWLREQSLR